MSLFIDSMYKISVKRNVLDSLILSDGSTGYGVIGTLHNVVNQQEMVAFVTFQS